MSLENIIALMPALLTGAGQTLKIFILTLIIAIPLGLPVSFAAMSKFKPLKALAKVYIWVFRGTPLMLQLFFFYYYIPLAFKLKYSALTAALIAFSLNYAAYFAEIYRAGIESIDVGQREAAKSLGFTKWKTYRFVILPQAFRRIIPPVSNEVITLIKDTALVNAIALPELLKVAKDATNRTTDPSSYLLVALFYLGFTLILTLLSNKLEARYAKQRGNAA